MGTRGAFGVRIDGQDKLTYNHFDSYPTGLGASVAGDVVKMLKAIGLEEIRMLARRLQLVKEGRELTDEQREKLKPYTDRSVGGPGDDLYQLTRKLQGDLINVLKVGVMTDNGNDFLRDSLFCEWAYVVNLDEQVLEVYRGFQRVKHDKGRYADLPVRPKSYPEQETYYPVALFATITFDDLLAATSVERWARDTEKLAYPDEE